MDQPTVLAEVKSDLSRCRHRHRSVFYSPSNGNGQFSPHFPRQNNRVRFNQFYLDLSLSSEDNATRGKDRAATNGRLVVFKAKRGCVEIFKVHSPMGNASTGKYSIPMEIPA